MTTYSPVLEERSGCDTSLSARPSTLRQNEQCQEVKHPIRLGTRGATLVPITPSPRLSSALGKLVLSPRTDKNSGSGSLEEPQACQSFRGGQWEELGTSADTEEWPDPVRPHLGVWSWASVQCCSCEGKPQSASRQRRDRKGIQVQRRL